MFYYSLYEFSEIENNCEQGGPQIRLSGEKLFTAEWIPQITNKAQE